MKKQEGNPVVHERRNAWLQNHEVKLDELEQKKATHDAWYPCGKRLIGHGCRGFRPVIDSPIVCWTHEWS
ncbi:hypothetical protein DIPPA_29096 [Diplonema papillatum]|nr:hypothetical protein DIPPA_29096 [Diplonema papillatum]